MATNRAQILITAVDQTRGAFDSIKRSLNDLGAVSDRASRQLNTVRNAWLMFAGALGVSGGLAAITHTADQLALVDARLKQVTGSASAFANAQAMALRVSAQTGAGYEAVVNLYTRLAQAADGFGLSQQQIARITEITARALALSGASASETAAVMRQLAQALGSGVLRGDEFNSIMENGARLAKALADGLGQPVGKLRQLAEQGVLTTDIVVRALESQYATIEREAGEIPQTIGRSLTVLRDQFGQVVRRFDETSGASRMLSSAINILARNLDTVLGVAAVTTSATLAAAFAKIVIAIKGSIVATYQKIAADIQAARSAQAVLVSEAAKAQAMVSSTQAAVAASAGMSRFSVAQVAANTAMTAGSIAARGLSAALGLVGGPLGLILTLLTAGATAWAIWGNKAKSATDSVEQGIKSALEVAKQFEMRKKYGVGDVGTLRKGIEELAHEVYLLGLTAKQSPAPSVRKKFEEKSKELNYLKKVLAEMEAEEKKTAIGAPSDLSRELARRQFDAYISLFRDKTQQLKDALTELRKLAKAAGISEISNEFRRAEAAIRAKFATQQKSPEIIKGEDAVSLSAARAAATRAEADAEFALLKDNLKRQQDLLDAKLEDRLVSIRKYYAEKTAIEQQEVDAEIARTKQLLDEQQRLAQTAEKESDRIRAKGEIAKLEGELIILNNRRADIERSNARRAAQAERELADALAQVKAEIAKITGKETEFDRLTIIETKFRDLIAKLKAEGNIEGVKLVNELINLEVAQANLNDLENRWRQAQERMRVIQENARIQFEAGLITQVEYQNRIADASREATTTFDMLLPKMEEFANVLGEDARLRVSEFRNELLQLQTAVNSISQTLFTDMKNAATTLFMDLISGAKRASDAFRSFAQSVIASFQRILTERLVENIFSSLGFSGFFAMLLKPLGLAKGGYVTGPGTSTSDSIPALLSAGEYVLNAAAVKRVGIAVLDAINGLTSGPRIKGIRLAFSAGGLVPSTLPLQQQGYTVRIVNVIDPSIAADYLNSSAGERTILNILQRNAGSVRQVIA